MIIGNNQYRKWGEDLLHALQYQKINRYEMPSYVMPTFFSSSIALAEL